jgi:hypothetical protein
MDTSSWRDYLVKHRGNFIIITTTTTTTTTTATATATAAAIITCRSRVVKQTTHVHVVLRSRVCGVKPTLSQYVLWRVYLIKQRHNFLLLLLINICRSRGVKLTNHLRLVPRPRMRGAIPPLPQYVIMGWCLIKRCIRFHDVVTKFSTGIFSFFTVYTI